MVIGRDPGTIISDGHPVQRKVSVTRCAKMPGRQPTVVHVERNWVGHTRGALHAVGSTLALLGRLGSSIATAALSMMISNVSLVCDPGRPVKCNPDPRKELR